jgi:hypothetical protein
LKVIEGPVESLFTLFSIFNTVYFFTFQSMLAFTPLFFVPSQSPASVCVLFVMIFDNLFSGQMQRILVKSSDFYHVTTIVRHVDIVTKA